VFWKEEEEEKKRGKRAAFEVQFFSFLSSLVLTWFRRAAKEMHLQVGDEALREGSVRVQDEHGDLPGYNFLNGNKKRNKAGACRSPTHLERKGIRGIFFFCLREEREQPEGGNPDFFQEKKNLDLVSVGGEEFQEKKNLDLVSVGGEEFQERKTFSFPPLPSFLPLTIIETWRSLCLRVARRGW